MSAVSAEENITVDDGTDSASDYIELESNQGYIENISENPILNDDVMDDDENISEEDVEPDDYQGSFGRHGASLDYGFNGASYLGCIRIIHICILDREILHHQLIQEPVIFLVIKTGILLKQRSVGLSV